ncbi:hypothetical protein LH51_06630 [Nitrincola sp. A-D6]|uniref:flagellar assembly protein T N-terminal domain-containing protein n=1 Tax=Nitrincola sp. A-D6 TaxID=1545442 RepID=UPI00051F9F66|nr:flagellar assembly protein T N-terminal domain-containing protein [Nitrincola sp. A-D6]KGK42501.1 hypothetical protein LH51_06630 [Nitrincola sp. A-D6]
MRRIIYLLLFSSLSLSLPLQANTPRTIEAEGTATIINGDLITARRTAVNQASEIATRRAAAFISSSSEVRDGELISDNTRIASSGLLHDIHIIEEQLKGNQLSVKIRAEVSAAQGCPGGIEETAYQRNIGFTAFPMIQPSQANAGGLHQIATQLPELLARELKQQPGFNSHTATHLTLHPNLQNAPTQMLDDGTLTNLQRHTEQTNMQYIVSGVIRDISQRNPQGAREPNILVDLYRRTEPNHERNQRAFIMDVYIHDALSGGLIWQNRYMTAGIWNAGQQRTGFATDAFWQQDYGDKVRRMMRQTVADINEALRCEPFSARITRTEQNRVWINAGELSGINPGDRLSVYRRYTHYDAMQVAYPEFTNTRRTLTIDSVQPNFASGTLNSGAGEINIQRDDIVKSH